MQTLHVCIVKDSKSKVTVLAEITSWNREPMFIPKKTCYTYFSIAINSQTTGAVHEDTYKSLIQNLYNQGFKIVPPDK